MNSRRMKAWANVIVASLLLSGCGTDARPGGTVAMPMSPSAPTYLVTIPVPEPRARRVVQAPEGLVRQVKAMVSGFPGIAGVAIRAVDEGWTIEANGRRPMPQQSVSKLWVAMTVLDQRDRGKLRLDDPVTITNADLTLFHQPIAWAMKNGRYETTVGNLLGRALMNSDNTANDKLLWTVGGPSAVREFIQRKRLGEIRFGPGERLLQAGTAGLTWQQSYAQGNGFQIARSRLSPEVRSAALQSYIDNPPDGAAPLAIADALARLARGELLSETSTRLLLDTMGASKTGRARLKASIPAGWELAHKTGTGQDLGRRNAGFNDVGLITSPDGRRYAVAVMIGDTMRPIRDRQMLIQGVGGAVTGYRPAMTMASSDAEEVGS